MIDSVLCVLMPYLWKYVISFFFYFFILFFMFVPCIPNNKIPLLKIQLMHLLCQLDKTKLKTKSH
jgi:hypothetical protein